MQTQSFLGGLGVLTEHLLDWLEEGPQFLFPTGAKK